jgi:toxin ParE1/3/4
VSRVSFTKYARQDLDEIYTYIAQDDIDAADKHSQKLQARWRGLLDQPQMGTKRDDLEPNLRSVTEGNYVIFYRIVTDGIEIVRVLHSSRDIEKIFQPPE